MVNRYSIFMWSLLFIWFNIINIWKIKSNKVLLFILLKWENDNHRPSRTKKGINLEHFPFLLDFPLLYFYINQVCFEDKKKQYIAAEGAIWTILIVVVLLHLDHGWSATMVKLSFKLLSPPTTLTDYDL